MAHGLGGTREMRLYEYAERFAAAGYACYLFDYRNYGASDGNKRQLINVKMQLTDWYNAIEFINEAPARTLLEFVRYSPGGFFKNVKNPIYVAACKKDNLAPAYKTIQLAKKAKNMKYKEYDCGHFNIYLSPFFEEVIEDYINFYNSIFE